MSKASKSIKQNDEILEVETVNDVPIQNKLSELDKMALELAKAQRQTALAEAKTALAQNEKAELSYKYVVLQLYMKYGLTERDAISENGDIIKEGATQYMQQGKQ